MKKNIEITGILKIDSEKEIVVDLFSNGVKLDWFELNYKHKSINVELSKCMGKILGINVTEYLDYMKLIADLGLEIPSKWKKHWAPKTGECYFYIDSEGEVCPNYFADFGCNEVDRRRRENFNMFPTRELAEKTINISKLGRLILLWQYANDCLFEPDWLDGIQQKYYIIYDSRDENACYDYNFNQKSKNIYFEKREQVKAFIDMYEAEIKELMNIK